MSWNDILGHEALVDRFRRSVAAGRLASTFLFVGPPGIGKRTFALKLAQALLCESPPESDLDPCEVCVACQQVASQTHPDLSTVSRPREKSFIPLEHLIGDDQHRMREGLCHDIALKPFRGGRKIAVIDDADYLNPEGANCLLKTLEEPPPKSVIILVGTSEHVQLPTIRSRSQIVRFKPLAPEMIKQLLLKQGTVEDEAEAETLAELSGGSLQQALEFLDPAVRDFRQRWLTFLATPPSNIVAFSKELSTFVDAAGSEAPPRRIRMKQVARWGIEFYSALLSRLAGHSVATDPILSKSLDQAEQGPYDTESAASGLERCLDAQAQVEGNANQATLLECWLDDLATVSVR